VQQVDVKLYVNPDTVAVPSITSCATVVLTVALVDKIFGPDRRIGNANEIASTACIIGKPYW
jgi:hypothetical protein